MKKIFFLAALMAILGLAGVVLADTTTTGTTLPTATATPTYKPRQVVVWGNLTAVSGQDLTVTLTKVAPAKMKNFTGAYPTKGASLVLHLTDKTNIVRQFFGRAVLSELAVGDKLMANGILGADGSVTAKLVRDTSIRKNFFSNKGVVTAIDPVAKAFTFQHSDNKVWTAYVTANTKFAKAGVKDATFADLVVGDIAVVRGVVRQSAMQITADTVKIVVKKEIKQVEKLENKKAGLEKKLENVKNKLEKKKGSASSTSY